jgi:hypothetical protein
MRRKTLLHQSHSNYHPAGLAEGQSHIKGFEGRVGSTFQNLLRGSLWQRCNNQSTDAAAAQSASRSGRLIGSSAPLSAMI